MENNRKKRVAILYGGPSPEYEVSLRSAEAVANAITEKLSEKYELYKIGITKQGEMRLCLEDIADMGAFACDTAHTRSLSPIPHGFSSPDRAESALSPDVIFPVLHGDFGENGVLQGILDYVGIPYVGCGVAASSLAYNKAHAKAVAAGAGVPVLPFAEVKETDADRAADALRLPLFLKPICGGSSLGASKVEKRRDFFPAYWKAATYGAVMAEPYVKAREIEIAVTETARGLVVSHPGEVIPHAAFYDYNDKYKSGAALCKTSVSLPPALEKSLREDAEKVFRALSCRGLSRVDFFLLPDGSYFFNEINTMPGFTDISLYPRMAALSLMTDFAGVIDTLLSFASEEKP